MKRTILVLLLLLFVWDISSALAATWTLQQCLDATVFDKNGLHDRLSAAREQRLAAKAAEREERAKQFGSFDLGGMYLYNTDVQKVNIPITLPGGVSPSLTFGDHNTYDFTVSGKYPLYMGGAQINSYRAAQSGTLAAKFDEESEKLALATDVRRAYFSALGTVAVLSSANRNYLRAKRHEEEAIDAQKVGTMSHEAVVQAKANTEQAISAQVLAQSDCDAALLTLRNVTRLSIGDLSELDTTEFKKVALDDTTQGASFNPRAHPVLDATESRIVQSGYMVNSSKSSWYPTVAVQGTYHYAKPGVEVTADKWMNYSTVGIQASWTLFDWGGRKARIEKAVANEMYLTDKRNDLLHNLTTAVDIANSRVRLAKAYVNTAKSRLSLINERQELVEERWKQGQATESEWIDASDDLVTAEQNVNSALVRYWLAFADELNATGKITE